MSVQQEILPRVSVNVGYFRNWWDNWYAVDNRATTVGRTTRRSASGRRSIRGCRAAAARSISGLYNLIPAKVGQVDELAQHSDNFAEQIENWQGVDVNVSARLRNGITVQGGHEHRAPARGRLRAEGGGAGARRQRQRIDNTGIAGDDLVNPYCSVVEPYKTRSGARDVYDPAGSDVQVSGTWRNNPGASLAANYMANNAVIAAGPQPLGRPLSEATSVTVNLIEPETFFAPRRNNIDMRVAKILRFGRTRTQVGLDIFNLTNNDDITSYSQTFSPTSTAWLTPTGITPARYIRFNAQFDF